MSESPAAVQPKPEEGAGAAQTSGFGLPVAIALIMGSIIGVGIFNLPTSLAGIGPITLVSMVFINKGHNKLLTVLLVLVGLWVPAVINLSGVKNMGSVQMVTTVLKFVALAFMSTVGLFYIKNANFHPWNISGQSAIGAIGSGMAIALFSYIGVEVASVAAGKVRDPDRNVPKSTVFGTLATAVVYMLSLIAVFGIVPSSELAKSNAPFSTAINTMFGGTWAGYVMSVVVIISGFGALNGWTMIVAEMPLAAAKDGLFDDRFKRLSKKGVPAFGIISGTVLASIAMAINYIGSGGATVFTTLILMTGITVAIPYGFSALAQIKWRIVDRRAMHGARFARDMIVAVLSLVFSILFIWYSRNTGHSFFTYWAPFFLAGGALLLGIPAYFAQRGKMTEPQAVPEYR